MEVIHERIYKQLEKRCANLFGKWIWKYKFHGDHMEKDNSRYFFFYDVLVLNKKQKSAEVTSGKSKGKKSNQQCVFHKDVEFIIHDVILVECRLVTLKFFYDHDISITTKLSL